MAPKTCCRDIIWQDDHQHPCYTVKWLLILRAACLALKYQAEGPVMKQYLLTASPQRKQHTSLNACCFHNNKPPTFIFVKPLNDGLNFFFSFNEQII